jgi:molecular chaperone HtpG
MKDGQKAIYYITADTLAAAKASPHIEGFQKRGYEVLLLCDRIDEWLVAHLTEFDGKPLESVARGAADLDGVVETPEKVQAESEYKETLERIGRRLGDKVESVRLSDRLTESAACLVASDNGFSRRLERMLQQAGESLPRSKPVFELNPAHPLLKRLKETQDDAAFGDLTDVLYDQAVLSEGGQLEDPAAFVKRLNKLILEGATERSASRIIV